MGNLAPDIYRVRVFDDDWGPNRYLPEWYHDAASLDTATDVAVVAGAGAVVDEDLVHRAEIVDLTSTTHPDQTVWYRARDVALQWTTAEPDSTGGYSFVLDQKAGTAPTKEVQSYTPAVEYTGVDDGVWYFHVRAAALWLDWPWGSQWRLAWGPTKHYALHIDGTAPTTQAVGAGGWHNETVNVTLVPDDPASGMSGGLAKTEYRVDGAVEWTEGTEVQIPVRATGEDDGTHTIAFRSTDAVGNVEDEQTVDVLVDTTVPQTWDDSDGVVHAADTVVSLTASDELSGVAETWYSLDGGDWVEGTEVLVAAPTDHSGDGLHTIAYYSVDAVGNVEAVQDCTVLIDTGEATAAPATEPEAAAPGGGG
jgi:hypothetical protein